MVSFVLHWKLPEKYFFYRVSKLEPDIFAGLEYFSENFPRFDLGFQGVGKGRGSFERYIDFNAMMSEFLLEVWPDEKDFSIL